MEFASPVKAETHMKVASEELQVQHFFLWLALLLPMAQFAGVRRRLESGGRKSRGLDGGQLRGHRAQRPARRNLQYPRPKEYPKGNYSQGLKILNLSVSIRIENFCFYSYTFPISATVCVPTVTNLVKIRL